MSEWITDRLPPIGKEVLLAIRQSDASAKYEVAALENVHPLELQFNFEKDEGFTINDDQCIAWKPLDQPTKFARWSAEVVVKMEEVE